MSTKLITVDFHGSPLQTFKQDDVPYVVMRPIVEAFGLKWEKQRERLNRDSRFHPSTPLMGGGAKGGVTREMLCLPLMEVNAWLFSINVNKVRADLRDGLILYQRECVAVLYHYWMHGAAINPRFAWQAKLFADNPDQEPPKSPIAVTDAWKYLMFIRKLGWFPKTYIINRINDGLLKGFKTKRGWFIELDALTNLESQLRLRL